jgi:hypothetical protein
MPGESIPSSFVTRIFIIRTPSVVEESDHTVVAIHTDQLPVLDPLGGNPDSEHRGDVVLAGNDRAMGVDAPTRMVDSSLLAIKKRTVNAAIEIPVVSANLMRRSSENIPPT